MHNNALENQNSKTIVLVADDDLFVRSQVKAGLKEIAHVIEAETSEQVLPLYEQHKPAVLLLDIHMPKESGKKLLLDILAYDPNAYVIMLSADSQKENVLETHTKGAKGFITKPFTKDTLLKYIKPALNLEE